MQVTPIKLSKYISSPKILKANQMLIIFFPHITEVFFRTAYWPHAEILLTLSKEQLFNRHEKEQQNLEYLGQSLHQMKYSVGSHIPTGLHQ